MTNTAGVRGWTTAARLSLVGAVAFCYGCLVALAIWLLGDIGVIWSEVAFVALAIGCLAFVWRTRIPLWWAGLTILSALLVFFLVAFVALIIALSQWEGD